MAAWSVVPLRSSDVKKAQTNPSADPDSSDQGGSWGGAPPPPPPGPPSALSLGFIRRVFRQSVAESYLLHPINSSDYPHDPSVSEPSRLPGNRLQ